MRRAILALLLGVFCTSACVQSAEPKIRDIYPDTWVGMDAIDRTMPTYQQVGPVKKDQRRVVGIFYITWHTNNYKDLKSPYLADVSKVLAKDPSARLDGKHPGWTEGSYHWGEPEMGYFLSQDEYVIRKDMSMLADAGVDVLVMDVTNAVRYWDEWNVMFPILQKMKAEGTKVPKFCFWAFNGPVITVVQDLYEKVYKLDKYKDLWFMWDGKPLLLYNGTPSADANGGGVQNPNPNYDAAAKTDPNNPHYGDPDYTEEFYKDYTKEVKDTFTLRTMWWGYHEWAGKKFIGGEDNWSFGYDLGDKRNQVKNPIDLVSTHKGKREEAAVTPGQHPSSLIGKSWTREKGQPELNDQDLPVPTYVPWLKKTVKNPEAYGIYFQQRWDEALPANPQFLYINDWNEWTAGKYPTDGEFMRRKNPGYFFVDQYNAEFNRCVQPMKGGYTDNYYMQMAQNIRKYKGVRPIPELKGLSNIKLDGNIADWAKSKVEYRDTAADVFHRDHLGYGGIRYTNDSGRNDIITSKVAVDSKMVYFYAQASKSLTPSTGRNWMLLLIDADKNPKTGWHGYEFLINRSVLSSDKTIIMKYKGKNWVNVAKLDYRYAGKALELAVPRELLGLKGNSFTFDFKWADNPADMKDPISLCINGDTAPNRRFNYRCIWTK